MWLRRILPPTSQRVNLNTKKDINEQILEKTKENIEYYKAQGRDAIISRVHELDYEWDIERVLETNASSLILFSVIMYLLMHHIGWIVLIGFIAAFLLQHALQGWCPPLPLFRRLGVRTSAEIDFERYSLKKLL